MFPRDLIFLATDEMLQQFFKAQNLTEYKLAVHCLKEKYNYKQTWTQNFCISRNILLKQTNYVTKNAI